MPQHHAYLPEYHGYYYFRPYTERQLFEDKELAERLGGDVRTPYSTEMFEQIYADLAGDDAEEAIESTRLDDLSRTSKSLPALESLLGHDDGI